MFGVILLGILMLVIATLAVASVIESERAARRADWWQATEPTRRRQDQ